MDTSKLAGKLEAVMQGVVSLESVLADPLNFEGEARGCYHGLQHYLADYDLRLKDGSYCSMQNTEMQKLIALLKAGANESALSKVTFLGVSNA